MPVDDEDPVNAILQAAMEGVARTDEALKGAHVTKWFLVSEHEWPDSTGRTLSTFRSDGMTPWEALGLLEFSKIAERERILGHSMLEDDDEA
jgi:hypothetical protein